MSHNSEHEKDYSYSKNNSNKKTPLPVKIAAGFIVGIIAIVIPSIAISTMYDSLSEVDSSSETITDLLITTTPIPEEMPNVSDGIDKTKKSMSQMSSIFSNFIQRP